MDREQFAEHEAILKEAKALIRQLREHTGHALRNLEAVEKSLRKP